MCMKLCCSILERCIFWEFVMRKDLVLGWMMPRQLIYMQEPVMVDIQKPNITWVYILNGDSEVTFHISKDIYFHQQFYFLSNAVYCNVTEYFYGTEFA